MRCCETTHVIKYLLRYFSNTLLLWLLLEPDDQPRAEGMAL